MASLLWLVRCMSLAIGFSPGLSVSRTIIKKTHAPIYCGEGNSYRVSFQRHQPPLSAIYSDKEQDACSQTPHSPHVLLSGRQ